MYFAFLIRCEFINYQIVTCEKAKSEITYRAHSLEHHPYHLAIVVTFGIGDVSALEQKAHQVSTEVNASRWP